MSERDTDVEATPKPRNSISNAQKIALRQYNKSNPGQSYKALGIWFEQQYDRKLNYSSISRILSPQFAFLDEMVGRPVKGRRYRPESWPELEKALSEWLRRARNLNISLTHDVIRQKARQFWPEIYPDKEIPPLSNGWVDRFQERNDLKIRKYHTSTSNTVEDLSNTAAMELIRARQLLGVFAPRDIFSCDETGLFWRMIPRRNVAMTAVQSGQQREQARISALFCCNSDGSERLPICFVGSSKHPAAFSKANVNLENIDCFWRSNKYAWVTGDIFKEWLLWFDAEMQGRKVALLLDKFSAHKVAVDEVGLRLENTIVVWIPDSPTTNYQPFEQGILDIWKAYWKTEWLQYMLFEFGRGVHPSSTMTILTAIRWSMTAWKLDLDDQTISECFKKALDLEQHDKITISILHQEIRSGLETLKVRNWVDDVIDIDQFLNFAEEKVADDILDIDSLILSQFTSSEEDGDEEDDSLIQSLPRISDVEALQSLQSLRLYEEQQAQGNKQLIQALLRHERILQHRAKNQYLPEQHGVFSLPD